ncbi:hypothetical protein Pla8534_01500 [Lignipirellula cremea]|uniref:Uncharacterized protein n=1 Tax=Lignipirellula cremea TaxID=2528010 RepID=A0A518DKN8_9BACT|nr:hypothetical protein Pla8534_01500 [Lignipirellula cremea]
MSLVSDLRFSAALLIVIAPSVAVTERADEPPAEATQKRFEEFVQQSGRTSL